VVKTLIAAGAGIEHQNKNRTTPLWIAAFNSHLEVVKTLMAAGANKKVFCSSGTQKNHRNR